MTPNTVIDRAIASAVLDRWQKVAMVIVKARHECEKNGIALADEDIAARIEAMVEDGRLDVQGDVSNWRFSEVRLPKDEREE